MMDNFREESVTSRKGGFDTLLYFMANVVWVMLAIYAFSVLNSVITAAVTGGYSAVDIILNLVIGLAAGGIALLTFLNKDKIRTEYEYTFTNGQMDFAKVFNNKRRKNLGTMNVRNVEACGMVASGSFNRYINMPGIKRTNWFLNRDAELFYFYFQKENQKRIIIIEPSEEMVGLIKKYIGQGVWQNN
ncbi:MAG: hypothetical protein IJB69_09430 [Clostridia bacterium]|nr:hypothetical protein [Clostridia bacterium]